jgi:hypothetical protein
MTAPTLKRINTEAGYIWEVAYAGMIKQHDQSWQAIIYYHQAMEYYHQRDVGSLSNLQLSQDSILDAASTSPTIPNDPSGDYAPSSMEQD